MRIRNISATLCVAISAVLLLAAVAGAAPTTVNVRIEGAGETLFEGPVSVTPHGVKASSDTVERSCDGINSLDPGNAVPAPTPTSTAADALSLIGETFDGQWYPGFNDYFIKRFGPDAEKGGKSWGVLVNNTFTDVGGCQYQLDGGDEVVWAFNAFGSRPFLALFPTAANYTGGTRPLTATATLGQPFEVEVVSYDDNAENDPAPGPSRTGSSAFAGADVSPVTTNSKGFEKVETGSSETVVTDSQGKALITFTTPGWHRVKATVPAALGASEEGTIRSNRLDVCVPAVGETGCAAPPTEDAVRVPQATIEAPARERQEREAREAEEGARAEREAAEAAAKAGGQASESRTTPATPSAPSAAPVPHPATTSDAVRVSVPKVDREKLAQGRVTLSWKVLEAGAGLRGWTISSQTLGAKSAPWVKRAAGSGATSATLRLPRGASYRLRLTLTDALGRNSTVAIGKVVVPGGRRG